MNDLERRVEQLESEVTYLRRVVETQGDNDASIVGPCPNCETGMVTRHGDELSCGTCGSGRFL